MIFKIGLVFVDSDSVFVNQLLGAGKKSKKIRILMHDGKRRAMIRSFYPQNKNKNNGSQPNSRIPCLKIEESLQAECRFSFPVILRLLLSLQFFHGMLYPYSYAKNSMYSSIIAVWFKFFFLFYIWLFCAPFNRSRGSLIVIHM